MPVIQIARPKYLTNENGGMRPIVTNVLRFIETCPVIANTLAYNEMSLRIHALKGVPWDPTPHCWTDKDDLYLTSYIQEQGELWVPQSLVSSVVDGFARTQPFHPVRDYLCRLPVWDGVSRAENWLHTYMGCEVSEIQTDLYLREVSKCTLVSAVARAVYPGCKVDTCLILEGEQGVGKSTAVKILAGEWYADSTSDLGSKDSMLEIQTWIVELSELDTMSRSEASRLKAFLSRSTDRFRPPYGRRVVDVPRSCIFIGTVNPSEYFGDETGARRFWPVDCGRIDLRGLARDRDQLWAEANLMHQGGEQHWLSEAAANDARKPQEARYQSDPWEDRVLTFARNRTQAGVRGVYLQEVLTDALGIALTDCDRAKLVRAGKILKAQGWRKQPSFSTDPGRSKWYVKPT